MKTISSIRAKALKKPKDDLGFFAGVSLATGFCAATLVFTAGFFGFAFSVNVKPQFLIDII
jgi:hypothetical protein